MHFQRCRIYVALGHEDIIQLLIKYDATVNVRNRIDWTPLFYSVLNGNERVVNVLLNHEDEDFSLNDTDAQGKTVFHICAEQGIIYLLIYINIRSKLSAQVDPTTQRWRQPTDFL